MMLTVLVRLGLMLLLGLPVAARGQDAENPPRPDRNPLRTAAKGPEKAVLPREASTVSWTDAEVAKAKTACAKMLNELALDYEALPPIKEGRCGAPAPILLKAVGSSPRVEIVPPATVTCAVAAALSAWLEKTVQPEARAALGAPVVKLSNASSYVCRNRYNGTETPLSEHALANALDVSEFTFQSGERATVLASWPQGAAAPPLPLPKPTRPAAFAAEQAEAEVAAVGRKILAVAKGRRETPSESAAAAVPPLPDRPPAATPPLPNRPPHAATEFVKKVHAEACKTFGTVLGPEANEAHKDHFHLDMKARRRSAFCE
jgi:hypothetical protein